MVALLSFEQCVANCARQGWVLRPCEDGYELLGNGPRATFGLLESVVVWCARWAASGAESDEATLQLSFLED